MSSGRVVITIDDDDESLEGDDVGNTTENQVQRLERELNSSRNTVTYLQEYFQGKITSLEAENARVQAKYARLQAKYTRLHDQRQVEIHQNANEDGQPRLARPPTRPRTEDQVSNLTNGNQLDEEEETEAEITVWINLDKNLETDSEVDDQAWRDLKAIWADQVTDLNSKDPNWISLGFTGKCLKTAVFLRGQNWTIQEPGKFACRNCTNTRKVCVSRRDGRLVALPLAPEILVESPSILQTYVADVEKISRKFTPGTIW
ncbi:hypothetical protein KCU92_g7236, partial [Aureobasidium melanogenum]